MVKEVIRSDGLWRFACGDVLRIFENGILILKLRACSPGNGTLLGVGSTIKSDICRENCAIVLSSSCLTSAACQIGHFHGFSWRERFPAISFASQILYREINRILIFPRQTVEPPLRTFIIIVGNNIGFNLFPLKATAIDFNFQSACKSVNRDP